ncbi:MAG: ferrous iron transport protein B [Verrucomicrobiae bacterium]|nr:ferrous iron transport protein B [Verrucomicrobiae bacterium]
MNPAPPPSESLVVLTGNPNCGKTTVFNALTGLRGKVGNYAGVTVERKEGRLRGTAPHWRMTVLDLPGAYSLSAQSVDEAIARDVLLGRLPEVGEPSVVVVVVDASNLERNLYFATQVIELGYPTVVGLNMTDVARANGIEVDAAVLSGELGVPVVPMVASRREGLDRLRAEILRLALHPREETGPRRSFFAVLPPALEREREWLGEQLKGLGWRRASNEALLLLSEEGRLGDENRRRHDPGVVRATEEARRRVAEAGVDPSGAAIEGRYEGVARILGAAAAQAGGMEETLSDRLDRVLTHRVWGLAIFAGLMLAIFQAMFSVAEVPMGWIEEGVAGLGGWVSDVMPEGDLQGLLADGVIAGVGAVIVFLPQIVLLFLFIGLLEDTGYMARAAFLMDRLMSKVGLHGKSFIPLLSSFACAIPGIMAARTIETPKDQLVTILVAPLMSCSARLPVYTVLIAACLPEREFLGFLRLSALTLFGMYALGIGVALASAWLFKSTLLRGPAPLLIMELPPYKRPGLRAVLRHLWDRSMVFLRRAGTVILVLNMVLWVLATYPRGARPPETPGFVADSGEVHAGSNDAGERLRQSYAGRLGRAIEPLIEPLGFDWKIGIGLVASFAAREVFVSAMSTVYSVGEMDGGEAGSRGLAEAMQTQVRPDGTRLYTPLTGITLMVFYVFALQCVSTVAVVRRETNSWRWPVAQWLYMTTLAWVLAWAVYQGGRWMGWGG